MTCETPDTSAQMQADKKRNGRLIIGLAKEDFKKETCVALTPMGVSVLTAAGHRVIMESGAGRQAEYSDREYSEAGAEICADKEKVFKSEILLKVSPCTLDEIDLLTQGNTLISKLNSGVQTKEYIQKLIKAKVVAVACEYIKTENDFYPMMFSTSEIAGRNAVITAAQYLSKRFEGKGVLFGGITGISPTSIVILGTGTAAVYAANAALGLGAEVKVFDNSIYNLVRFTQKLGREIFTSVLQPAPLLKALQSADVVIGAKSVNSTPYPIVTEEYIMKMKKGSVIMDLNVETGSCFETSRPCTLERPSFEKNGITHFCLANPTATVPRTASIAHSNVIYPVIINIGCSGGVTAEAGYNPGFANGIYIYKGKLTNDFLGHKFNIPSRSINFFGGIN